MDRKVKPKRRWKGYNNGMGIDQYQMWCSVGWIKYSDSRTANDRHGAEDEDGVKQSILYRTIWKMKFYEELCTERLWLSILLLFNWLRIGFWGVMDKKTSFFVDLKSLPWVSFKLLFWTPVYLLLAGSKGREVNRYTRHMLVTVTVFLANLNDPSK